MAVISINYNEGSKKDLGYKSVEVNYGDLTKQKIFKTGDFVKDWYDCMKFMITKLSDTETHFSNSSSVNHFMSDGGRKLYDSTYLITPDNKEPYLKYSKKRYDLDENGKMGIEFFIPKGTKPTWSELRKICRDIKKNKNAISKT